jgi:hypothetical protein
MGQSTSIEGSVTSGGNARRSPAHSRSRGAACGDGSGRACQRARRDAKSACVFKRDARRVTLKVENCGRRHIALDLLKLVCVDRD